MIHHWWIVALCKVRGHKTYRCDEEMCYDYGHLVCQRCSQWFD